MSAPKMALPQVPIMYSVLNIYIIDVHRATSEKKTRSRQIFARDGDSGILSL